MDAQFEQEHANGSFRIEVHYSAGTPKALKLVAPTMYIEMPAEP
jgi:hypothetical protein